MSKKQFDRIVVDTIEFRANGSVENFPIDIPEPQEPVEPGLEVPEPPAEGVFVLTSTDGVLSWETLPDGGGA